MDHSIGKSPPLPDIDVNELSRDQAFLYKNQSINQIILRHPYGFNELTTEANHTKSNQTITNQPT